MASKFLKLVTLFSIVGLISYPKQQNIDQTHKPYQTKHRDQTHKPTHIKPKSNHKGINQHKPSYLE